jgi:RND family efflux transporter MFP subunit
LLGLSDNSLKSSNHVLLNLGGAEETAVSKSDKHNGLSGRHRGGLCLAFLLLVPAAATAAPVSEHRWQADVIAQAGSWNSLVSTQGRVRAWREVSLTSPFALSVESVSVEPGQRVDRGKVLGRFNPSPLRTQIASVKEAERRAELAHHRVTDVQQRLANKLATRNDRLQAETELSQAQSDADSAWQVLQDSLMQLGQPADRHALSKRLAKETPERLAREWATVRAPLAAVVTERAIVTDSRVVAGELLFRLDDLSRIVVGLRVAQAQAGTWLHGTVTVDVPNGGPLGLKALTEIPEVDRQTGLVMLRFEAPNDAQLLDGQWVTVHLEGPARSVVWVPAAAVVGRAGKTYCVRRENGRFVPVEVTVGAEQDGRIPVLEGLSAGDRVVTKGAYLLLYRDLNQLMQFQD